MGKMSTKSRSSSNSTSRRTYGNTTTSNPYATATTNNSGTKASFQPNTALDTIYNVVNNNIGSLLDDYLNPNINSNTNKVKLNAYQDALNSSTYNNLENSIINPLSRRNMVRSSQATDLYKNLSDKNAASLDSYISDLLSTAQNQSGEMINNLLQMYMQGYDVLSNMQSQSLQTSSGNATSSNLSSSSSKTTTKNGVDEKAIAAIAKAIVTAIAAG